MKGTLAKRGLQCSSLEKEVAKAVADKATLEKRLVEVEAKLGSAIAAKAAAESAEEASRIKADSQARRASDLESEFAVLRADFEAEVAAKVGLQAELAEIKVDSAKEKLELREAVSRLAKQDSLLQSLSCRLAAAEQGIDAARVEAVEAFKDSQAFADAVAECSTDSYHLGFTDCKEAAARLFPDLDLSRVRPPDGDEEGEEEATDEQVGGSASVDVPADAVEESADPGS